MNNIINTCINIVAIMFTFFISVMMIHFIDLITFGV